MGAAPLRKKVSWKKRDFSNSLVFYNSFWSDLPKKEFIWPKS